jgi:hypothetical protein
MFEIDDDEDERRKRRRRDELLRAGEILGDGQVYRVPLVVMDSLSRSVAAAHDAAAYDAVEHFRLSRPGPRLASDAQRAECQRAYDAMVARDTGAWRGAAQVTADSEQAAEVARDQVSLVDSRAIREAAWERMCEAARQAWRNP